MSIERILLCLFFAFLVHLSKAQCTDTIYISDFGLKPYSYENSVAQLQAAIEACKQKGGRCCSFQKGDMMYGRKELSEKNFISRIHLQKKSVLLKLKRSDYCLIRCET